MNPAPKDESGLIQFIRKGKSIRHIWFKKTFYRIHSLGTVKVTSDSSSRLSVHEGSYSLGEYSIVDSTLDKV